jgi:hypothetical protein
MLARIDYYPKVGVVAMYHLLIGQIQSFYRLSDYVLGCSSLDFPHSIGRKDYDQAENLRPYGAAPRYIVRHISSVRRSQFLSWHAIACCLLREELLISYLKNFLYEQRDLT